MGDRELQVRECAYYFWEAEGRPEGRAQMHWAMAEIATTLFSYLNAGADRRISTTIFPQRVCNWHPESVKSTRTK
jgi:hypothetical protein